MTSRYRYGRRNRIGEQGIELLRRECKPVDWRKAAPPMTGPELHKFYQAYHDEGLGNYEHPNRHRVRTGRSL